MFLKLQLFCSLLITFSAFFCEVTPKDKENLDNNQTKKNKPNILRTIYLNFFIRLLNGESKEINKIIEITSQQICNSLGRKYGLQLYGILRDEKVFEEAVQKAYQDVKSNRISYEVISSYILQEEFKSIKSYWEISCFLQKIEHLASLLQENIDITEEEEIEAEKILESVPERRFEGFYVTVNSLEDAENLYNSTINSDKIDLEKQEIAFNKIGGKYAKVKSIALNDKNYMTFEEILANFGSEFADLAKIKKGISLPILKNQFQYLIFFIKNNQTVKPTKAKIRRYAVSKKILKLTENLKKAIEINNPIDLLKEDHVICNINGLSITVLHLLKFLELKIPGKSIKRLVGSMPQNKANMFIQTAVSSLIDVILQAKLAQDRGIEPEELCLSAFEIENFFSKICKILISNEEINAKYEELKNNQSFVKRIKYDQILVESKILAGNIFSLLQKAKEENPATLKETFAQFKKKYSIDQGKNKDLTKNEFLKSVSMVIDSISSEQKIDFESISDGKFYIAFSGENYYVIFVESIYDLEPTVDQIRGEIISQLTKEKTSSIISSVVTKAEKTVTSQKSNDITLKEIIL